MIGQLTGILLEKQAPHILLDVNGVGYEIDVPLSTFYQLPDPHQKITLLTHFVVREDAHHLYGFLTRDERTLFRTLLKVNGIGPRLALTILSSASVEAFVASVLSNDTASLVRLPGIGKKTAERLVIEMRDKLADFHPASLNTSRQAILQDAISALISLGYKQQEAGKLISKLDDGKLSSEDLIRASLKVPEYG